jgi:hypothetical protein
VPAARPFTIGLSAVACTVTTVSPSPATGSGKSWNDGGTPNEFTTAAFIISAT